MDRAVTVKGLGVSEPVVRVTLTTHELAHLVDYYYEEKDLVHNSPRSLRFIALGLISWRAKEGSWGCWITDEGLKHLEEEAGFDWRCRHEPTQPR